MKGFTAKELVGLIVNPLERVVETLERKLGLFSVVIISLASMLGTGLFVIPALSVRFKFDISFIHSFVIRRG